MNQISSVQTARGGARMMEIKIAILIMGILIGVLIGEAVGKAERRTDE